MRVPAATLLGSKSFTSSSRNSTFLKHLRSIETWAKWRTFESDSLRFLQSAKSWNCIVQNSTYSECGSVQAYPLKTVRASQLPISAMACYNIWREMERKKRVFLPVCIQSKCRMSDRGIYYEPYKKNEPSPGTQMALPHQLHKFIERDDR